MDGLIGQIHFIGVDQAANLLVFPRIYVFKVLIVHHVMSFYPVVFIHFCYCDFRFWNKSTTSNILFVLLKHIDMIMSKLCNDDQRFLHASLPTPVLLSYYFFPFPVLSFLSLLFSAHSL